MTTVQHATIELLIKPCLLRSYKAQCSILHCTAITYVYNAQRTGGICSSHRSQILAVYTITKWFNKCIKRRSLQLVNRL